MNTARQQPGMFRRHTVTINEAELHDETDLIESSMAWPSISSIEEDKTHIFLFTGPNCAYIIPKRAFSDEDEAAAFAAMLRTYWNAAKR